jgi:hypothetical protein
MIQAAVYQRCTGKRSAQKAKTYQIQLKGPDKPYPLLVASITGIGTSLVALDVVTTVGTEVTSFHSLGPTCTPHCGSSVEAFVVTVWEAAWYCAGGKNFTLWSDEVALRSLSAPSQYYVAFRISSLVACQNLIADKLISSIT